MQTSTVTRALKAGVVGASALNALHESARRIDPNAPRVDSVAMRAVQRFILGPLNIHLSERNLYVATLAGDLISNSLFYAGIVGAFRKNGAKSVVARSVVFGLGAGLLTAALPPLLRLGRQPTREPLKSESLTVAWYAIGALVTAAAFLAGRETESSAAHDVG